MIEINKKKNYSGESIIAISGVARSGKDSVAKHLIDFFAEKGRKAKRYAMADLLKLHLYDLINNCLGINVFDCTDEEKELIRPIMVAYGGAMRARFGRDVWANDVLDAINKSSCDIAIITDLRFVENNDDEYWALRKAGAYVIHIQRIIDGDVMPPPNSAEAKNDPILKDLSDCEVRIHNCGGTEEMKDAVRELYENLTKFQYIFGKDDY